MLTITVYCNGIAVTVDGKFSLWYADWRSYFNASLDWSVVPHVREQRAIAYLPR